MDIWVTVKSNVKDDFMKLHGIEVSDNYYTTGFDIKVVGSVKNNLLGDYILTYVVTDDSGNSKEITRTVTVIEENIPSITLLGEQEITIEVFGVYNQVNAELTLDYGKFTMEISDSVI